MSWIEKLFSPTFKLANRRVILSPINDNTFSKLKDIAVNQKLWRFNPEFYCKTEEVFQKYMNRALEMYQNKSRLPLTIYDNIGKREIGSTSYYFISEQHKRITIGYTFIGEPFQKQGLNYHINYLMIQYAFEVLQAERVEYYTDLLNIPARNALQSLGVKQEAILRSHMLRHNGKRRDTIVGSILKDEWPNICNTKFQDIIKENL